MVDNHPVATWLDRQDLASALGSGSATALADVAATLAGWSSGVRAGAVLVAGAVSWVGFARIARRRALATGAGTDGAGETPEACGELADRVRHEVDVMTSSIEQLAAEANAIAFNAMISKSASEQARESMSDMTTAISRMAALAEETEARSQRVSELSAEGESRAQAAVADMDRLAGSFAAIEQQVRPLVQHAGSIGSAADLIHRIASQTKLLSLNATIEAVRAGDRGAGFAVVAEEVRKLADASSTASLKITTAVSAIQEGTATVADGVDQAAEAVHTGLDHVARTFELLSPIRSEADDTLVRNREIAEAMRAEADVASTVVESMHQVLEVSDQTETVVNQALETSVSMSRATDSILAAIGPPPKAEDGEDPAAQNS